MKNRLKKALLAAAGVAAVLPAHATYVSGDLLVGFGQTGAAKDYIYDIGSFSSLTSGEQWNLSTGLSGQFSSLNNLNFGVVGAVNLTKTIYSTSDGTFSPAEVTSGFNTIKADVATIGQSSVSGNAVMPPQTVTYSWTYETRQPAGTPGAIFQNDLDNPNVVTPSSFTSGTTTSYLYANDNLGDPGSLVGTFSLDSTGILTFSAVPEPTGCALLGLGILALRLCRKSALQR